MPPRLHVDHTALLAVDMQQKLVPLIHDNRTVVHRAAVLIEGCAQLGLPIFLTEQYRKGLGQTVEAIERNLPVGTPREEKTAFSACVPGVWEWLKQRERGTVLICGVEAHVCVLQTVLDLVEEGYAVAFAADAIGSRRERDHDIAVRRMTQSGAAPVSVETALMEMLREAGNERFKSLLPLIKKMT